LQLHDSAKQRICRAHKLCKSMLCRLLKLELLQKFPSSSRSNISALLHPQCVPGCMFLEISFILFWPAPNSAQALCASSSLCLASNAVVLFLWVDPPLVIFCVAISTSGGFLSPHACLHPLLFYSYLPQPFVCFKFHCCCFLFSVLDKMNTSERGWEQ
jgi:hypothetical protein